jgi:hypothetical protein
MWVSSWVEVIGPGTLWGHTKFFSNVGKSFLPSFISYFENQTISDENKNGFGDLSK